MQICRSNPSFAATSRDQIVQYLEDAEKGKIPTSHANETNTAEVKGVYTIRPLLSAEFEFSTPDVTAPVGLKPEQLERKARDEGWVGMRVDLWDQQKSGMLVKVRYWWREEGIVPGEEMEGDRGGRGWRQCLHDIVYLGMRDGSEGGEGSEILE